MLALVVFPGTQSVVITHKIKSITRDGESEDLAWETFNGLILQSVVLGAGHCTPDNDDASR